MVLVDTSVWIAHFRKADPVLKNLLENSDVACHPLVVGELACGSLHNRAEILALLHELPMLPVLEDDEALYIIERRHLWGKGLGIVDVHLFGSALASDAKLWTLDKNLHSEAARAKISFE